MLATFENKHQIKIYETEIIKNLSEIEMLEKSGETKIPEPIVEKVVYIEAMIPQARSGYHGRLTEKHKKEFPKAWAAFQNKQSRVEELGTPLSEMPNMSQGIRERFNAYGITTIEQVADIDDITAMKMPMGIKTREQAKGILAALGKNFIHESGSKMSALEKQVAELMENQKAMQEIILEQKAMLEAKKKGRPFKEQAE